MPLRLFSLLVALLVAAATVSPCTAAALARAERAAPGHADADSHGGAPCHGPSASIGAQCPCGCADDAPRSAASAFSAPWALPAPSLARVDAGRAPVPPDRGERPRCASPSPIEHVPISV